MQALKRVAEHAVPLSVSTSSGPVTYPIRLLRVAACNAKAVQNTSWNAAHNNASPNSPMSNACWLVVVPALDSRLGRRRCGRRHSMRLAGVPQKLAVVLRRRDGRQRATGGLDGRLMSAGLQVPMTAISVF
jgi:hypothetical protein